LDTTRIKATLPTLQHLLTAGTPKCVVLLSHRGRPTPGVFSDRAKFSLAPVATKLQELLASHTVRFLPDCVGPDVEESIESCAPGTVFLCENTRFWVEESGIGKNANNEVIQASPAEVLFLCFPLFFFLCITRCFNSARVRQKKCFYLFLSFLFALIIFIYLFLFYYF
jgi:3-phosphoglycerate kinase